MSPFIGRSGSAGARGLGLFLGGLKNISDLFTRTAGSLGISTSGHAWTALRGTWTTNGTQATSADAGSSYPIGSIPFQANITTSADVSGGVGLAFWVTDANNWWASYPTYVQNTINTCNAGYVSNTSNPPSGSCCSGVNSVAGASNCDQTQVSNTSNPPAGNCCSGVGSTAGSTVCNQVYENHSTSAGFCQTPSYTAGSTTCTGATSTCTDTTNTCTPSGGSAGCPVTTQSGYNAYQSDYSTFGGSASSLCIADGGTSYTAPYCNFPASWTRVRSTEVVVAEYWSGYTATSTTPTTYQCYTAYSTGPTTYNCYTSNTVTYSYDTRIVVVSSVSGSVVTDSTTTLVSGAGSLSPVNSLKVVTSGDQITATAYSSAGLASQLGSPAVRTPTTPTKGPSVGIIKGPSTYNQGSTIDNYSTTKP